MTEFTRLIVLGLLPLLAGCMCDPPPVERIAAKTRRATKRVAVAVPAKSPATPASQPAVAASPPPVTEAAKVSATSTLRIIHVKNCDCPEDFDPNICGDRSAYTTWSPNCPSAQKAPASIKGSTRP